jgi:hypothetical protein
MIASANQARIINRHKHLSIYNVVQIWPGQTVTCLHTNSPGHISTTLYNKEIVVLGGRKYEIVLKMQQHNGTIFTKISYEYIIWDICILQVLWSKS